MKAYTNEEMIIINRYLSIVGLTFEEATKDFNITISEGSISMDKKSFEELYGKINTEEPEMAEETTETEEVEGEIMTPEAKIFAYKEEARAINAEIKELRQHLKEAKRAEVVAINNTEAAKSNHGKLVDSAEAAEIKVAAIAVLKARELQSKASALVEALEIKIGMAEIEAADYTGIITTGEKVVDIILDISTKISDIVSPIAQSLWSKAKRFFSIDIDKDNKVVFASKATMVASFLAAVGFSIAALGTGATIITAVAYYSAMTLFSTAALVLAYFSESGIRVRSRLIKMSTITVVSFAALMALGSFIAYGPAIGPIVGTAVVYSMIATSISFAFYLNAVLVTTAYGLGRMAIDSIKTNVSKLIEVVFAKTTPVTA